MPSRQPFDHLRPDGDPSLLFLCDHATNIVPPELGDLGLPPEELSRHIAWDIGARGVAAALSDMFEAPAVMSRFSRLVIDPNRGEDDPTVLMRLYDGAIIPGNRHADAAERERRLAAYHRPYHAAIDRAIDRARAEGAAPRLISIHSFTPQLRGREPRPWHVAILHGADMRLAGPLIERLREEDEIELGVNEPYPGELRGDCMWRHGRERGEAHVLIEIRQDLIADPQGQEAWAELIGRCMADAFDLEPEREKPFR